MANDNNNSHIIIYAIHKKTWVIILIFRILVYSKYKIK